jgi:hypothetical protein
MSLLYDTPGSLAATNVSASRIDLTWANSETTAPIEVQRKPDGGLYATIYTVNADLEVYSNTTGLSGNTKYYYRIRYNDGANTSAWATEAYAYTNPSAPTGLAASFSGKTATLTWTNPETYSYIKVYFKLSSDSSWTIDTETLTGTLATRDIVVTTENAAHDFRICGYNSTSTLNSDYITITSQTSGVMAPTGLVLSSASMTSVTVTWNDNSSVEDGYEVWYFESPTWFLANTTAANIKTYTITGLTTDYTYTIRVRAKNGAAYSAYATDTIKVGIAPDAAPVIGTVTVVSQTSLTVTWTCAATNEGGFEIYRSTDNSTYTLVEQVATPGLETYTDTGLTSYTLYYYKIKAYNEYGVSALSGGAHNTTLIDLDPATLLIATVNSSTSITIDFTVNAGNATSHNIERKVSGGSYASVGSTASGTIATFTDGTCSADPEYTYRVRAYSSVSLGYGDYSVPITKKTLAVGTDTVRRNEAYFAMGNVLAIISETPQNLFEAYWRSRPLDFSEIDPADGNKNKTVDLVQLEYTDTYANVPIVVSLSNDGGVTWVTCSETVGTGDLTDKIRNFFFAGVTGKYITMKASSTDNNTGFTWTGIILHYIPRGEYMETS